MYFQTESGFTLVKSKSQIKSQNVNKIFKKSWASSKKVNEKDKNVKKSGRKAKNQMKSHQVISENFAWLYLKNSHKNSKSHWKNQKSQEKSQKVMENIKKSDENSKSQRKKSKKKKSRTANLQWITPRVCVCVGVCGCVCVCVCVCVWVCDCLFLLRVFKPDHVWQYIGMI